MDQHLFRASLRGWCIRKIILHIYHIAIDDHSVFIACHRLPVEQGGIKEECEVFRLVLLHLMIERLAILRTHQTDGEIKDGGGGIAERIARLVTFTLALIAEMKHRKTPVTRYPEPPLV